MVNILIYYGGLKSKMNLYRSGWYYTKINLKNIDIDELSLKIIEKSGLKIPINNTID